MHIIDFNDYIPTNFKEFIIHKNIVQRFNKKINSDMQSIVIYGPEQSGKKTIMYSLIKHIYNIDKLEYDSTEIDTNIFLIKHDNFIQITIEDKININEKLKNILTDVFKTYFEHLIFIKTNNISFKLLIINNAHYLNNNLIAFILNKMSIYITNVRVIFVTKTIQRLNKICSNCFLLRVNLPTQNELKKYINNIIKHENINVKDSIINTYVQKCNQNIVTLNLLLQNYILNSISKISNSLIYTKITNLIKNHIINYKASKDKQIIDNIIEVLYLGYSEIDVVKMFFKNIIQYEKKTKILYEILNKTTHFNTTMCNIKEQHMGLIMYILDVARLYS